MKGQERTNWGNRTSEKGVFIAIKPKLSNTD